MNNKYKRYLESNPPRPKATKMWANFLKNINKNIINGDIQNFREWGSIRQTMITSEKAKNNEFIADFEKNVKMFKNVDQIFEFGGGSGLICKLIHDKGFTGKYTIFDFPELIAIQKYSLDLNNIKGVEFISNMNSINSTFNINKNNLFISLSALEESPREVFLHFLKFATSFDSFLFRFSGGKGIFEKFMEENKRKWTYYEIPWIKSVYMAFGKST